MVHPPGRATAAGGVSGQPILPTGLPIAVPCLSTVKRTRGTLPLKSIRIGLTITPPGLV